MGVFQVVTRRFRLARGVFTDHQVCKTAGDFQVVSATRESVAAVSKKLQSLVTELELKTFSILCGSFLSKLEERERILLNRYGIRYTRTLTKVFGHLGKLM